MKLIATFFLTSSLLCTTGCTPPAKADNLTSVTNLVADAAAANKMQAPILVLFTSPTCPYCKTVINDFLLPMQRDPAYANKVILRQIETGSSEELTDFDGTQTTQQQYAAKHKIYGVPVIKFISPDGKVLSTITGLLTLDYYQAYLDNAIDEAIETIRSSKKIDATMH